MVEYGVGTQERTAEVCIYTIRENDQEGGSTWHPNETRDVNSTGEI